MSGIDCDLSASTILLYSSRQKHLAIKPASVETFDIQNRIKGDIWIPCLNKFGKAFRSHTVLHTLLNHVLYRNVASSDLTQRACLVVQILFTKKIWRNISFVSRATRFWYRLHLRLAFKEPSRETSCFWNYR